MSWRTWRRVLAMLWLLVLGIGVAHGVGYTLAAQDKITVTVLRHPELSQTYVVPPDGFIDFPRAGKIDVTGKSTAEVAAWLTTQWGLVLRNPDVTVLLTEPRSRNVYVLGAVARPGAYPLTKGARVTEMLAAAGDLVGEREKLTASLMRGKETLPINLMAAVNGSNLTANLVLREGDVLWIQPQALITVVVIGQVRSPGSMKLVKGSRVLDALAAAGDLTGEREKLTVAVMRGKSTLPVNLASGGGVDQVANPLLEEGDVVTVQTPVMITVVVSGEVRTPGPVKLEKGSRVLDALAKAGDLTGEREKLTAAVMRGDTTLSIALQSALSGADRAANLSLEDGDLLLIQSPAKISVAVSGQVRTPGIMRLDIGATLVDALTSAGDVTERPERLRISLSRTGTTQALKWGDTITRLQNGDVIFVEREAMVRVYVNGQVKSPGAYDLLAGDGALQAIALAGGLLPNAALGQVTVVQSDGKAEQFNLAPALLEGKITANPRLATGDQVIVPESNAKISVLGMVNRPGTFTINETNPLTVIDALSLAGGAEKRARLSQVAVIRMVEKKPRRIAVDVNTILKKGKQEQNIVLQSNDIVFVPETDAPKWNEVLTSLYQMGILVSVL